MQVMRAFAVLLFGGVISTSALLLAQTSSEEVARRTLETGRAFARQGNYTEALRDFRTVAETHNTSSVADDALLEIARYFFDIAGDVAQTKTAVDTILKQYPTSNAAPDAMVMAGRLALAGGRQASDIDGALANFERVIRVYPDADAVPDALLHAGEAYSYSGKYEDALVNLSRVTGGFPSSTAAASASLGAATALLALGDPMLALEELQQVRNRWPNSPQATTALARLTLIHRLYVRARGGPAYTVSSETAGPARLLNVNGLIATRGRAVYYSGESAAGVVLPADAPPPPAVTRPRGLTLDADGNLVIIEIGGVKPFKGASVPFIMPKPDGSIEPMTKITAAVQLSNGQWIVMDEDQRFIQRFTDAGKHVTLFAQNKVTRMAINRVDQIAAIDRDKPGIIIFDGAGKTLSRIPLRGTGYELPNPEDLAFDNFGHLYVLDRVGVGVFSPYPATPVQFGATAAATTPVSFRLQAFYPASQSGGALRRGAWLTVDESGAVFLYDERAQRVLVLR
jgi:TolA-binding protein